MSLDWLEIESTKKSARELLKSIPLDENKDDAITVRLSKAEKKLLKAHAKKKRISLTQFLINPALETARGDL